MSVDILVPALGESVTEATIARWLKQPGESVAADEPLVELETGKVTVEVPAPEAGVLSDLQFGEGDSVEVGALLGRIVEGGGEAAKAPAAPKAAAGKAAPTESAPAPAKAASGGDPLAAAGPAAKKAAADLGVSADAITPTGRDGRATKADVHAAASSAPAPARWIRSDLSPEMSSSTPSRRGGDGSQEGNGGRGRGREGGRGGDGGRKGGRGGGRGREGGRSGSGGPATPGPREAARSRTAPRPPARPAPR